MDASFTAHTAIGIVCADLRDRLENRPSIYPLSMLVEALELVDSYLDEMESDLLAATREP